MKATSKVGDCETCIESKDVKLTLSTDNMFMCAGCMAKVAALPAINSMIAETRKIDMSIELKTDILVAKTTAIEELRASIEHDDTIPADQKDYVFAKECLTHFQHLREVVFEKRQELLEKENEMRAWQVNVQTAAAKLKAEYREQFKAQDITYEPKKVKSIKPQAVKTAKKFDKAALYEAAKKYGVPSSGVQSIIVQRNWSAEQAAKHLAGLMGLI